MLLLGPPKVTKLKSLLLPVLPSWPITTANQNSNSTFPSLLILATSNHPCFLGVITFLRVFPSSPSYNFVAFFKLMTQIQNAWDIKNYQNQQLFCALFLK